MPWSALFLGRSQLLYVTAISWGALSRLKLTILAAESATQTRHAILRGHFWLPITERAISLLLEVAQSMAVVTDWTFMYFMVSAIVAIWALICDLESDLTWGGSLRVAVESNAYEKR